MSGQPMPDYDVTALLLTADSDGLDPGPEWHKLDSRHWVAPLGAAVPCFGRVERIPMNTAALHESREDLGT